MVLSSLYHTFECHASNKVAETCFSLDILGITVGLMATYLSGLYYAFYCEPNWRDFYLLTVGGIFVLATSIQFIPAKCLFESGKKIIKFTDKGCYIISDGSFSFFYLVYKIWYFYRGAANQVSSLGLFYLGSVWHSAHHSLGLATTRRANCGRHGPSNRSHVYHLWCCIFLLPD